MSHEDIIRAWKDEEYRNSLSEEQRAHLPENPAGMVELGDTDMESIAGGFLAVEFNGVPRQTRSLICFRTLTNTCRCRGGQMTPFGD
jgi:mersacidin/lichenicidin family type 2 lantibiotic